MVTLDALRQKHPERAQWENKLQDYRLLYVGGHEFLSAAGTVYTNRAGETTQPGASSTTPANFNNRPVRRFLHQLEGEPNPVYFARWNRAYYTGYLPAIIDYFAHWLFSQPPIVRPAAGEDTPDWWADFFDDCTGSGKSLLDFMRDRFIETCIYRRSGWLIGKAGAVAQLDDDDDGDGRVCLTPYNALEIYDWQDNACGELEWIVLHKTETRREFPGQRMQVETFTVLDRQAWQSFEVIKGTEQTPDQLSLIGEGEHGLGMVPFVRMEVSDGLWVADKIASAQVDLFNQQNMLSNAQLMGCILQPYIKTSENRETAQSRIIGENVLLHLRAADSVGGGEEDFGWKSPDVAPLQHIADAIKEKRDEIYRLVHQMALAVDSKSIGAIARSGASKIEDRKASEITLAAYGGYVRAAIEQTALALARIYGDDITFTVDGFDNFQVSTLDEEIQIGALAQTMNFKSRTARERIELKLVRRLLDHEDEKTNETIEQETREAFEMEAEGAMAQLPITAPGAVPPPGQVPGANDANAAQPASGAAPPTNGAAKPAIKPLKKLGYADKEAE